MDFNLNRQRLLQIVAAVAVLHLPLLFVIQWRQVAEPNRRQMELSEPPHTQQLRGKVLDVSQKTIDDLVNNLDDDWINQHSELYLDDTCQSSYLFDTVVMNLETRRLVFELRQHFSEDYDRLESRHGEVWSRDELSKKSCRDSTYLCRSSPLVVF